MTRLRARVDDAATRVVAGRPNGLERVLCAVAVAGPAAIRAAAALGDIEPIAPCAAGGPVASASVQRLARSAARRRWPHLARFWRDLAAVPWPHGLDLAHPEWRLVAVPTPTTAALAEAAAVLDSPTPPDGTAANAHAIAVVRARTARGLARPWDDLTADPTVDAGLDALTDGTPWAGA